MPLLPRSAVVLLSLGLALTPTAVQADDAEALPPEEPAQDEMRLEAAGNSKRANRWADFDPADLSPDSDRTFDSKILGGEIVIKKSVFHPIEAETRVLPLMNQLRPLFKGRRVLEIGTGSGPIAIRAAQLGASKVVATDINPAALASTNENAERFAVDDIVETRLVPETDMSAYSVIEPDEKFDVILSNPPYSLDMTAETNTPFVDTGDLGFSIVNGLEEHLSENGVVILLYDSGFYHKAMVEYAKYRGWNVEHNWPGRLFGAETTSLFNSLREQLLKREGVDPNAFVFDAKELPDYVMAGWAEQAKRKPLFGGKKRWPGFIVILPPGVAPVQEQEQKQE